MAAVAAAVVVLLLLVVVVVVVVVVLLLLLLLLLLVFAMAVSLAVMQLTTLLAKCVYDRNTLRLFTFFLGGVGESWISTAVRKTVRA